MNNRDKQKKYIKYLVPGSKVLELGSGCGDFLNICREAGIEAAGVEKDRKAACNKGFKVFNADIRVFLKKEKSGRYGSIYARHVVEHFFPGDLRKLFKAVHRVIKKSGRFITVFPNAGNLSVSMYEFWKDETHARPYPGETVKKMLEESGFKIVESGPDKDSWDNAVLKNIARGIRSVLTGIPSEAPDYFIVAEK